MMKEYDKIKMVNDKYISDGIKAGDEGYILEIYDDHFCEVEFSEKDGTTYALQAIDKADFMVVQENKKGFSDEGEVSK